MTKRLLMILTLACVLPTAACDPWWHHHRDDRRGYYGPPGRGPGPGYYH
nr:hypothetical protein [uncultured Lichenicoccus sp.]